MNDLTSLESMRSGIECPACGVDDLYIVSGLYAHCDCCGYHDPNPSDDGSGDDTDPSDRNISAK